MLHGPAPANVRYKYMKQYSTAGVPLLTVGKIDIGKWMWKYATAISPASTNATGRVKSPSMISNPPNVSRIPAIPNSDRGPNCGRGTGGGGKWNNFVVPYER
jgi:hypothetical protein